MIDTATAKVIRTIAVSSPQEAEARFQVTILWSDDARKSTSPKPPANNRGRGGLRQAARCCAASLWAKGGDGDGDPALKDAKASYHRRLARVGQPARSRPCGASRPTIDTGARTILASCRGCLTSSAARANASSGLRSIGWDAPCLRGGACRFCAGITSSNGEQQTQVCHQDAAQDR